MPKLHLPPVTIHQRIGALDTAVRPWSIDQCGVRKLGDQRGAGAVWGFVDTGYSNHPDLADAVLDAMDFTGSIFGPRDIHGHGTHTLGTFCGRQRQDGSGAGFANAAKAVVAKGLGDDGTGEDEWTAAAIYWCVDKYHVHGINLSLGSPDHLPLTEAAIRYAHSRGAIVVVAAGNEGDEAESWPALLNDYVISVGATNRRREASRFSEPSSVDIAAPGEEILSCYLNGRFAVLSGTSMSAPWISALLATEIGERLALGKRLPAFDEWFDMLDAWAEDIDEVGDDPKTGNGLATVERYMQTKNTVATPPPAQETWKPIDRVPWKWLRRKKRAYCELSV